MSSSRDLAAPGLAIVAGAVNLTAILSQTSNLPQELYELGQWLALERVDRTELYDCFRKARGLVYANKSGQGFYNEIATAKPTHTAWPLNVRQSGSLGRLIIQDPHLAWIASTTACLFQFHNERFISEAVCMIIMLSDPTNEGRPESELRYLSSRVELKAVIDRIISSLWFNVLNSGTNTSTLPAELDAVCVKGHHLNGDKFGIVVHALKQPREKVVLESTHLLKNLALWLLIHFQGMLTVSVSGKMLLQKQLGDSTREVELKVLKFCNQDHDCSNEEDTYRLFSDIKGAYEELLSGSYPSSFDMPETAMARRSLYDVMKAYDIGAPVLSEALRSAIRRSAQAMVKWLVSLPLTTPVDADFGFSIKSLYTNINAPTTEAFTTGTVFGRSPSILNFKYGNPAQQEVVCVPGKPVNDPEMAVDGNSNDEMEDQADWVHAISASDTNLDPEFSQDDVIKSFPLLKDLVSSAHAECDCYYCSQQRRRGVFRDDFSIALGCKAQSAISAVLLYISHAIADGFGATDVSGTRQAEPLMAATLNVFSEILRRQQIRWDSWFSVAACVYLGCPFRDRVMDIELGGTAFAAIQYGNLSVVAPWLDLTKAQDVQRCFRFKIAQGQLGVMRESNGAQQFRGIPERFAIVQAEHTEDTSNFSQRFEKWSEPLTGSLVVRDDDSTFESEVTLVTADDDVYRLWIRIRSDTFIRIIDPVDSMIRLARSLPYVECEHKSNRHRIERPQDDIKLYNFDELLGRWQNEETFYGVNKVGPAELFHGKKTEENTPGLSFHMTTTLHHDGMVNVARALSVNYMVIVNQGNCCLSCAISKAKAMPLPENSECLEVRDRYIINVKTSRTELVNQQKRSHATISK
jgi:hypothetical protein